MQGLMGDAHRDNQDELPPLEDSDEETERPRAQPLGHRQQIPTFTPTPAHKPPHKSIHEERHPDETAGGVLRWEQFEDQPKPQYDPMWENKKLFEHAEWLGNVHVSDGDREKYLRQDVSMNCPGRSLRLPIPSTRNYLGSTVVTLMETSIDSHMAQTGAPA